MSSEFTIGHNEDSPSSSWSKKKKKKKVWHLPRSDGWLPERSPGTPWSQQTAAQDSALQPLARIGQWPAEKNGMNQNDWARRGRQESFKWRLKENLVTFTHKRAATITSDVVHVFVMLLHLLALQSWLYLIYSHFQDHHDEKTSDSLQGGKLVPAILILLRVFFKTAGAVWDDRCCVLCGKEWKTEATWLETSQTGMNCAQLREERRRSRCLKPPRTSLVPIYRASGMSVT